MVNFYLSIDVLEIIINFLIIKVILLLYCTCFQNKDSYILKKVILI